MGVMRVHLSLGDTVYVSDEKDHGIIEQFVPYGKIIVRLVKEGKSLEIEPRRREKVKAFRITRTEQNFFIIGKVFQISSSVAENKNGKKGSSSTQVGYSRSRP